MNKDGKPIKGEIMDQLITVRMSKIDVQMMDFVAKRDKISRSDAIRKGIFGLMNQ